MWSWCKQNLAWSIPKNRRPIRAPVVGANAHPMLNAKENMLPIWNTYVRGYISEGNALTENMLVTHVRPYISDIGARKRGPIAKESKKILSVIASIVSLVIPYLIATSGKPGAIMEDANGDTNVYNET